MKNKVLLSARDVYTKRPDDVFKIRKRMINQLRRGTCGPEKYGSCKIP